MRRYFPSGVGKVGHEVKKYKTEFFDGKYDIDQNSEGLRMTRGRRPERLLERAREIAETRGMVREYQYGPGTICHFTIYIPGCLAEIRIKRVRHLRCSAQWLEREAADELAGLRLIPSSGEISRELWICAPNSNFRFFRVCDTQLVELERDGRPLPAKSPAPVPAPANAKTRRVTASAGQPGPDPKTSSPVPQPCACSTLPSETTTTGNHQGE